MSAKIIFVIFASLWLAGCTTTMSEASGYRYPESLPEAPPVPGNQNAFGNAWNIGFSPEAIGSYLEIGAQALISGLSGEEFDSRAVTRSVSRAYSKSARELRKEQKTALKARERQYKQYLKNAPKVTCVNGNSYRKAAEMIRGPDNKLYVGYYYDENGTCRATETSYGRSAPGGIPDWQHRQQVRMPDGRTMMVVPAEAALY